MLAAPELGWFLLMKVSWLGVDTGGTFTDLVLFDGERLRTHKVLSTPDAPERAILQGIADLGVDLQGLRLVHGSTVATNAVLEGKGVRTAYITNRGFADVLQIGRQARRELYNLQPQASTPVVDRALCLEVNSRLSASGEHLQRLDEQDLQQLRERLQQLQPRAVAINLLFSFLDSSEEQRIEACVPEAAFISRASDVLPEYREYERGMTTCLNAYVGPLMQGYLQRLERGLSGAALSVMQSAGGTIGARQAGHHAVNLLLSGPAGGLKGAQFVAALGGEQHLLSFDMGGTSTDVALLDGGISLTSEGHIGEYPVAVPMVDMHTIGAGGGSIARVDAGGLLLVGPESAGADPGPACYGRGGSAATVTDANLVLGRLRAEAFLGGGMMLDSEAANTAVARLAAQLGMSLQQTALGIVRLANEHMARALRVMSVQRGVDPSRLSLVSFGGAGGLHVCALAEALGMGRALVPIQAGVLSALGMLVAAPQRELSQTHTALLSDCRESALMPVFAELERRGTQDMAAELGGVRPEAGYSVDLRYQGQSFTLNLPWQAPQALEQAFHELHLQRYGHRLNMAVELVNLRVSLSGPLQPPELPQLAPFVDPRQGYLNEVTLAAVDEPVAVYQREQLGAGQQIEGPALIVEKVSTTLLAGGWHCRVDDWGNLQLYRTPASEDG
jgi:N-methylhydantoinase A